MSINTILSFLRTSIVGLLCLVPVLSDTAFWTDAEWFLSGLERTFTNEPQPSSAWTTPAGSGTPAQSPANGTVTTPPANGNNTTKNSPSTSPGSPSSSVTNPTANTPSSKELDNQPQNTPASGASAVPWKTTDWSATPSDSPSRIGSASPTTGTSNTPALDKTIGATVKDTPVETGGDSLPSLLSAPSECWLPEVEITRVEELPTKSILHWKPIPNVGEYDVYKQTKSGGFALIERTKKTEYTVHLSQKDLRYEEFRIAAVCKEMGTASKNLSKATSVRTGPLSIFLMFIASLLIGALLVRWRKNLL